MADHFAYETLHARPARLLRRADFVATSKGKRVHMRSFVLQGRPHIEAQTPRFGFTVTKKIGNSVVRNRVRRRLKEALRLQSQLAGEAGHDYVVVARIEALTHRFDLLGQDLHQAIKRMHAGPKPRPASRPSHISAMNDRAPNQ